MNQWIAGVRRVAGQRPHVQVEAGEDVAVRDSLSPAELRLFESLTYSLTDRGEQARHAIVQAVAAQLRAEPRASDSSGASKSVNNAPRDRD
jgi:hypothetical protein